MAGYNEMLRRIEPEKIICYNTPFPEMQGNIVYVDYERSSWKYMSYERGFQKEDLDAFKIGRTLSPNHDTIEPFLICGITSKGGGSAYGLAVAERHYTDHNQPWEHSNPNDHHINWESPRYWIPNFEKTHINYWPTNYPNGAPEFKSARSCFMNYVYNSEEENRFKTISEFKECLIRGGEVEFTWNSIIYSVT